MHTSKASSSPRASVSRLCAQAVLYSLASAFAVVILLVTVSHSNSLYTSASSISFGGRKGSFNGATSNSGVSGRLFSGTKQRTYPGPMLFQAADAVTVAEPDTGSQGPARRKWAVCTTIFRPSDAILRVAALQDWQLVVVGDEGGAPFAVNASNTVFLDVKAQQKLASSKYGGLLSLLPWKHFGRKNVGYLYAIMNGADTIWDFDDDNVLKKAVQPAVPISNVQHVSVDAAACKAFNPYPQMGGPSASSLPGSAPSWPRGFPLQLIRQPCNASLQPGDTNKVAVMQSLADNDPDVDGIFRLTRGVPFSFQDGKRATLVIPHGTLTPWNAQVHGRVSDIWRSYITQRLLWDVGYSIAFAPPMVDQFRSPHNYLADMQAEEHLYYRSGQLVTLLQNWQGKAPTLAGRFEELMIEMYEREYVGYEDVALTQQWLRALAVAGYTFPPVLHKPATAKQSQLDAVVFQDSPGGPLLENVETGLLAKTDILLPITGKFVSEFRDHLLTSLLLFYPMSTSKLQLVLDGEKPEDHLAAKQLSIELSGLGVQHQVNFAEPDPRAYHRKGHTRQQLVMFWADNYTSADYVGFVDTDTTFVTRVVESDVFDVGKPRIIGQVGKPQDNFWKAVPASTEMAIGQKEIMRCMSFFPVVIKVVHLQKLRAHVERLHGLPFDRVFANFTSHAFSQFNIMCNYLWYFHKDEYAWSLQEMSVGWADSVPGQVQPSVLQELLKDRALTHPVARTTVHAGYLHFPDTPPHLAKAMLQGFCLSGGSTIRPAVCSKLPNSTVLQSDLFVFETNNWTWDSRCMDAQHMHYSNVQRSGSHPWNLTLVDELAVRAAATMQTDIVN